MNTKCLESQLACQGHQLFILNNYAWINVNCIAKYPDSEKIADKKTGTEYSSVENELNSVVHCFVLTNPEDRAALAKLVEAIITGKAASWVPHGMPKKLKSHYNPVSPRRGRVTLVPLKGSSHDASDGTTLLLLACSLGIYLHLDSWELRTVCCSNALYQ